MNDFIRRSALLGLSKEASEDNLGEMVNGYICGYLAKAAQAVQPPPPPPPPSPQPPPPKPINTKPPRPKPQPGASRMLREQARQRRLQNKGRDPLMEAELRKRAPDLYKPVETLGNDDGFLRTFGKNLWSGTKRMGLGLAQGALTVGRTATGLGNAALNGLATGSWDEMKKGYRSGKNAFNNLGTDYWTLGTLSADIADMSREEKNEYMDRNNIDPNNMNWMDRAGVLGTDIADFSGQAIPEFLAWDAAAGAVMKGFKGVKAMWNLAKGGRNAANTVGTAANAAGAAANAAGTAANATGAAANATGAVANTAGTAANAAKNMSYLGRAARGAVNLAGRAGTYVIKHPISTAANGWMGYSTGRSMWDEHNAYLNSLGDYYNKFGPGAGTFSAGFSDVSQYL